MQQLAHLEATGEELQSCTELSAVEEALQGSQALQSHLTLLKSQQNTSNDDCTWMKTQV